MKSCPRHLATLLLGLLPAIAVAAEKAHPGQSSGSPSGRPTDSLFDPSRHMRVAEVRPGMKGYGLSVFSGTKIEPFDVEVISVLHNFNPKYDVVLIKCKGANLELTGAVAGMSGSPIYLKDDQGHDRMIGAFAYGWPMTKEPLAGVQPIEYMLTLPAGTRPATPAQPAPNEAGPAGGDADHIEAGARLTWSLPAATGWPTARRRRRHDRRRHLHGSDRRPRVRLRPPVPERRLGRAADGRRADQRDHPEHDHEL